MFALNKSYDKIRNDLGIIFRTRDYKDLVGLIGFVPVEKTFGCWFGIYFYWPEKDGDV